MDSRDWLILKTIDEEKSITKTANRLFVSQPSLTYRFNKLEKEFDTILLKRYSSGVSFTAQGECLLKYSKEMLEQLSNVNKRIQSMNNPIAGNIRLGISTVFAKYRLAPILKGYSKRFPDVNVILKTGSSTCKLPGMLESRSVDLIIRRGNMKWCQKKHVILDEPNGIISSKPIDIDKIYRDTWIQDEMSVLTEDDKLFYRWWKEKFKEDPTIKIIQVNSIEACIEMVSQGLGWGFLPKIHVQNKKNIYFYPLIWPNGKPIIQQTVMLYRNEALKQPAVKKFVEYILTEFKRT